MNRSTISDLVNGAVVRGIDARGPVTIINVSLHGSQAVTVVYKTESGNLGEQMVFKADEGTFEIVDAAKQRWSFDGDAEAFRLAAEARRIQLAHLFDPYVCLLYTSPSPRDS